MDKNEIPNMKSNKYRSTKVITFVFCMLFFLIFAIIDGPVICVDSESYITMDLSREPIYPLFLAFFRKILGSESLLYGEPAYLFAAVLAQSIIWGFAVWKLGMLVFDETMRQVTSNSSDSNLNDSKNISNTCDSKSGANNKKAYIFMVITIIMQFLVCLLNRFAAGRGSMYSESIMTESLAMPIFLLFCISLYKCIRFDKAARLSKGVSFDIPDCKIRDLKKHLEYEKKTRIKNSKNFLLLLLEIFILISIRKQMAICLIIAALIFFLYYLCKKNTRNIKRFVISFICLAIVFESCKLFDMGYNYILRGRAVEHTGNGKAVFCNLMFCANADDAQLFDSYGYPELKDLFTSLITECKSAGLLYDDMPSDLSIMEMADFYADSYDIIGFNIAMPIIFNYIDANFQGLDEISRQLKYDEIMNEINDVLMHEDMRPVMQMYIVNVISALVTSNARSVDILVVPSFAIYFLFILLYICMIKNKMANQKLFAEISFLGIVINSLVVAALIFPQPRYMIYSMGMFYASLIMMMFCFASFKLAGDVRK